jgi:hypothetical protein
MPTHPPAPARLFLPILSVDRLLDKDSSPIALPGLHPDVAQSLIRLADDHPPRRGYEIVLQVPAGDMPRLEEVRKGLQNWSLGQAHQVRQEVRAKLSKGSKAFFVAIVVVAALFVLIEWLQAFGTGRLSRLFGESLVIIAWVSLWVPVETLLVEPIALRRRRILFEALANASVKFECRP